MARIKWNEYLSGRYKGVNRKPKKEVKVEPKVEPKTDNKIVGNGGDGGVEIPKASDRRIKNMFGL